MVNIERPDFDEPREQDGFRAQRARIGRQAGAVKLGASRRELPHGEVLVFLRGEAAASTSCI